MLIAYQQTTRRLLLNDQTFARANDFDLRDWINSARNQIAAESECIRVYATLAIAPPTQQYPFSSIAFPAGTEGVATVQAVRDITYSVAAGRKKVYGREWEFFNRFYLSTPVPVGTWPKVWAQYGQGTQGTIWVNLPDIAYTLNLDTVCLPSPLASDTDFEAVPQLWTDAVPYFAAYMAFLQFGDKDNADRMFQLFGVFMQRAREGATPTELPHQFAGGPDMTMANKFGVQPKGMRAA